MRTYVLLQRLPNLHEGAIFWYDPSTKKYVSNGMDRYGEYTYYDEQVLIDNPKWFKLYEDTERLPIGIYPEWLWKEQRLSELHQAIKRYREAKMAIPNEWVTEINDLFEWLQINLPSKKTQNANNI